MVNTQDSEDSSDPDFLVPYGSRGIRTKVTDLAKLQSRSTGQHIAAFMIVVLPFSQYLDEQIVHVGILSTMRVLYLVALMYFGLRLRHMPLGRHVAQIVVPPALVLTVYLIAIAFEQPSFTTNVGVAIDVTVLPVLFFVQIWRTGLEERRSTSLGWATSLVLLFEVYVGIREFLTNHYFFTYADEQYVLSYGQSGAIGVGVRATGTFMHPEEYALVCGLLGLFLMHYWMERQRPVLVLASSLLALTACGLSGLRGILIPLVLLMVGKILHKGPNLAGRFFKLVLVSLLLLTVSNAVLSPFNNSVIQDRLSNSENVYSRIAAFKSAIGIFVDHPVLGVGYGQYTRIASSPIYSSQFAGVVSVPFPHNTFLALLAEAGLIGFVLYLWLWFAILKAIRVGLDRRPSRSESVLVAFFLLSGLSLNLGAEPVSVGATLILTGALASSVGNRQRSADVPSWRDQATGRVVPSRTSMGHKRGSSQTRV